MSKTKGNVVDPLQVVDEVGADALRFSLVAGTSPGHDQRLTRAKIDGARNFTNKLWNVARFVLGARPAEASQISGEPTLAERWITSRVGAAVQHATAQLDAIDLAGYAATVHELAWSDYADWFVEMAKFELRREDGTPGDRARVWATLAATQADLLRLLHPLMPFVTEAVWSALHDVAPEATRHQALLLTAAWPSAVERDPAAESAVNQWMATVRALRNQRTELGIPPSERLTARYVSGSDVDRELMQRGADQVSSLARLSAFDIQPAGAQIQLPGYATPVGSAVTFIEGAAEDPEVAERRRQQRAELQAQIERLEGLLRTASFVQRAPAAVVEKERSRLADLEARLRQLS